jgi:hypothetical protein
MSGRTFSPSLGIGISGTRERVRQFGDELNVSRAEPGTLGENKIPLFNSDIGTLWRSTLLGFKNPFPEFASPSAKPGHAGAV